MFVSVETQREIHGCLVIRKLVLFCRYCHAQGRFLIIIDTSVETMTTSFGFQAPPSVGSHLHPHSHSTTGSYRLGRRTRGILHRTATRTRAQWLENSAQVEVDTPLEVAWSMWEDREKIPTWMPWITSVEIQQDDKQMSKWTLSTYQFNRQWEFSWLARNMTPLQYQKIHWRSVPGSTSGSLGGVEIQNQGQIRFLRKGDDRCAVKLTISYQVPSVLAPFANVCGILCVCMLIIGII